MTKKILTDLDATGRTITAGTLTAGGLTSGLMVKTTTGGQLTTLAAGSTGQYLQYDGTWSTPSGGSLGYVGSFQTTASAGSTISLTVPSVSSGSGNTISIQAGTNTGSVTGANGGAVTITGGSQTNASAVRTGGSVTISGGTSGASGTGGIVYINGGVGGSNGNGTVNIGTTGTDSILLLAPTLIQNPVWLTTSGNAGTSGQVLTSAGSGSTPTWSDPFVFGALDYTSGSYYTTPFIARSSLTPTLGDAYLMPFIAGKTQTFTKLTVYASSVVAGSSVTLGVYNSTSAGAPNSLITSGSVATTTSVGSKTVTGLSIPLTKGQLYWLAVFSTGSSAAAGLRSQTSNAIFPVYWPMALADLSGTLNSVGYLAPSQSGLPSTWSPANNTSATPLVWISY